MLDNNTAKGLTNINKGVQFSPKQHSSLNKNRVVSKRYFIGVQLGH